MRSRARMWPRSGPERRLPCCADVSKWRQCCVRAVHTILWACQALPAGPYQPLSKHDAKRSGAELAADWQTPLHAAQQRLSHEVSTALQSALLTAGPSTAVFEPFCPGEGTRVADLTSTEIAVWQLAREGAVCAVACAMLLPPMAEACGVPQGGGFAQASRLLQRCMVCAPVSRMPACYQSLRCAMSRASSKSDVTEAQDCPSRIACMCACLPVCTQLVLTRAPRQSMRKSVRGQRVACLQDAVPAQALPTSAAHHSLACLLATLAVLPSPTVPFSASTSVLAPLVAIFPSSGYVNTALHCVYRRAHQLCHLRIGLSALAERSGARAAAPFVLAASGAVSERAAGHQHARAVFEAALAGTPLLADALRVARAQAGLASDAQGADTARSPAGPAAGRQRIDGVDFASLVHRSSEAALPLANAPVVWLAYMQMLVQRGAVAEAHAVLLRALAACPWCQSLWLRGLRLLAERVQGLEAPQLLDAMQQRGLSLRTLPAEVLLERMQDMPLDEHG